MSFRLTLGGSDLDLFPDFTVEYSIEVYNALNPDEVKSPINFSNRFPYTATNAGIITYDFDTDRSNYPVLGKTYFLYDGSGNILSAGIAYLSLVVVNSDEPYFELKFEDNATALIKEFEGLDWSDLYADSFSTTVRTLGTYIASEEQYDTRDIELAYIDVCNDNEKFNYEARQFTGWGLTGKKVGLFPTLNVQNFLFRIFTAAGETLQSAFASNLGTWKTNNLYTLVPSRLMRNAAGQRTQTLTPYSGRIFINEDLATGAIPSDYAFGVYQNSSQGIWLEDQGTNYAASPSSLNLTYGAYHRSNDNPKNIPDPQTAENRLGYAAWSSGFSGNMTLLNNGDPVDFKLALPAVEYEYATDEWGGLLINSFISVDEATFTPRAVLYRSGSPIMEVPLLDFSGNPISLTVDFFEDGETVDQEHHGGGHQHENAIVFNTVNVHLDVPVEILAASQYSIGYKIHMEGNIEVELVDDKDNVVFANKVINVEEIAKARVYGYNPNDLAVEISTAGAYAAIAPTDQFTFQFSLQNSATLKPYEVFSEIVNRFGLSIIYDYTSSSFILDTLNDIRSASTGVPLDDYVDNLLPFEVSGGQEKYAFFRMLNQINDGLYDKRNDGLAYGSFDGAFATGGQGKYSVQLDGALINGVKKTICGDIAPLPDQAIQKLLPSQEVGIVNNEIPDYLDVGLRFFYLRQHQYKTTVRYPAYIDLNQYGQLVQSLSYKVLGLHFLGGYPINVNGDSLNLEFGSETAPDDFFTYYTSLDKIQAPARTKMKFNAAVPTSYITNLYFFNQYFSFESPTENFVIDSVQGRIFDNYFYGEFTVRFL
jgi:hypothetical protein